MEKLMELLSSIRSRVGNITSSDSDLTVFGSSFEEIVNELDLVDNEIGKQLDLISVVQEEKDALQSQLLQSKSDNWDLMQQINVDAEDLEKGRASEEETYETIDDIFKEKDGEE